MSSRNKQESIAAGQAWLDAFASDPKARQALAELRKLAELAVAPVTESLHTLNRAITLLGQHFGAGLKELRAEQERSFAELAGQIEESLRSMAGELAARGFDPPGTTLEDWEHLARIVEKEPGPMTLAEIYRWAIAWADREKVRLRLAKAEGPSRKVADAKAARAEADREDDVIVRRDPNDERVAWCMGKRIYLGRDTQVSRLFWLLARPVCRGCSLAAVQRAVLGMETSAELNVSADDVRKAGQSVRKAISKLRQRLRESGADQYLKIIPGRDPANPEYTMVFTIARNR